MTRLGGGISLLTTLAVLLSAGQVQAQPAPQDRFMTESTEQLVEDLLSINAPTVGLSGGGVYDAFIAEDKPPEMTVGLLPVADATVPPAMRELVRRGAAAMPVLLAHVRDSRPTGLTVGGEFLTWREFAAEYDPRKRSNRQRNRFSDGQSFESDYHVTLGDVCEVLIGQIVNRNLSAVRYQPTGGLVVNSPVVTSSLANRIEKDWKGLDAEGLKASLLQDIEVPAPVLDGDLSGFTDDEIASMTQSRSYYEYRSAFVRLRYYYPETYAALTGDNAAKRAIFEAEEAKQPANGY